MKIVPFQALPWVLAALVTVTQPSCTQEAKKERSLEAALKHFEKGAFAAAEIEYNNALAADPGNAEAIKYLGIIRNLQGAYYEAAAILTQVKAKLPKDDEVGINLAKALLSLGFVPDCRNELLEILDRFPDNGDALMFLTESSITPEWLAECEQKVKAAKGNSVGVQIATALLELRHGAFEKGSAMVEDILKSNPTSARAHSLKASILSAGKLPDEALAELKIAADSGGLRSNESITYALALMSGDRRDDALAYLNRITTQTPDFLPAWTLLGQIAFSEKKDDEATRYFSKVLTKSPIDLPVAMMQAEILVRGKEPEKAVELLEKVAGVLPSRPPLELALAKCLISADKLPKAAATLDRILAASPNLAEAGSMRAMIDLREGKTAEAIAALEAIRAKAPKDAATRDLLIQAYRISGRNDDAVALLQEKSAADPADSQSRIELGQLLISQGKFDEARAVLENSAESISDSLSLVSNLANIDLKTGKAAAALKRFDDFIVAHPDSSEAYVFKAGVAMDMKNPKLAEQSLVKALELKADNAQAYALYIRLKSGPGQEAEQVIVLDSYLKAFPKDANARLQQGNLLQQLGRYEESRTEFLQLIADQPESAVAHNNLAALESVNFNNLEKAADHARKARSLDPAHPAIADTLGWIEWQLGSYPAALSLLTEAAAKMSTTPSVLYHLGMAQYSMGKSAESAVTFTKALETDTEFPEKPDTQKHLALLRDAGKTTTSGLDDLKKRVANNPKDVILWLQLADLLARGGQPQEAFDAYQKALDINPATPTALAEQARLYAGPLKSPEKALAAATQARKLAPRDPMVLAAFGLANLVTGAHQEAYGLLKDASVSLDNDPTVAFDYARAAYCLGRIPEARAVMARVAASEAPVANDAKQFLILTDDGAAGKPGIATVVEESLAKDPGSVPALMLRGSMDFAAGANPEATYQKILVLQPRFDPARVRLAAFYMGDPTKLDQALKLATEARANMPSDQELTRMVAVISYRQGDFQHAAQLFAELSTQRPLLPDELLVLGLSFANSNQPEKARQPLETALKSDLSDADAAQARAALSKLDERK